MRVVRGSSTGAGSRVTHLLKIGRWGDDRQAADAFLSDLLEVQLSMNQRYNADVLQSICRAGEVVTESSVAKRSSRIADDIELASFRISLVLTESEMEPDVLRKYEQWLQR